MNEQNQGPSEEQVQEATSLGWAPQEAWRGDPDKWIDADEFLRRGIGIHHLREKNTQLETQVKSLAPRVSQLESALRSAQTTIDALEESHADDVAAQVEAARAALREEIAQASRDGDHEALATATDKLTQLNSANKEAGGKDEQDATGSRPKKDDATAPRIHPEVVAWFKENQDYVSDKKRVALLHTVGAEMREAGETSIGKEFLDKCAAEVDKYLGKSTRNGTSKTEGGNGGGGRGNSGGGAGKSYSDLPADAKAACDKQAQRLVGPNRAHKDINSWRKKYAETYFRSEQ